MDDSTPTEAPQPPERRFRVKLIQTVPEHEVVAEQFESVGGEPLTGNKKDALQKVQNFFDDEKDMGDIKYRLEVEEIEAPEPVVPDSQS